MKNEQKLENHPNQVLKELIIKNALTPAEMKSQNTNFYLLKLIKLHFQLKYSRTFQMLPDLFHI